MWRYRKTTKLGPFRLTATHKGLTGSIGGGGFSYQLFGPGKKKKTPATPTSVVSGLVSLAVVVLGTLFVIGFVGSIISRSEKHVTSVDPNSEVDSLHTYSPPLPDPIDQPAKQSPAPVVASLGKQVDNSSLNREIDEPAYPTSTAIDPETAKVDSPIEVEPQRLWTDSSGKHKTRASLLEFAGGIAYLKNENGRIGQVPVSRLSTTDREFLKSGYKSESLTGVVSGVSEGDLITVRLNDSHYSPSYRVRLRGIDAPSKRQDYGREARILLSKKLLNEKVIVEWRGKDSDGRLLGNVFLGKTWVNREQVLAGNAWERDGSEVLRNAHEKAKAHKLGLWAQTNPLPPWEYKAPAPTPRPEESEYAFGQPESRSRRNTSPYGYQSPTSPSKPSYSTPSYSTYSPEKTVQVRGYYRKDGTYVRPHTRRPPRR